MSSSPVVIQTDWFTTLSSEIKKHHLIISLLIAAVLLWHCWGRVLDYLQVRDSAKYQADTTALKAQLANNVALAQQAGAQAAQNAKDAADYKALAQQLAQSNAQLTAHEASIQKATETQQATDRALAPTALAGHWASVLSLAPTDITATPDGTFTVSPTGAISTVVSLDELPGVKSALADESAKNSNLTQQLSASENQVAGLNNQLDTQKKQITGLQTTVAESDQKCADQVKLIKVQAARSKRRWFIAGYVAGVSTSVTLWLVKKF